MAPDRKPVPWGEDPLMVLDMEHRCRSLGQIWVSDKSATALMLGKHVAAIPSQAMCTTSARLYGLRFRNEDTTGSLTRP